MRFSPIVGAILLIAAAQSVVAQQATISAPCEDAGFLLTPAERSYCYVLAQTVASAQPLLGILIGQGEVLPGGAASQGDRRATWRAGAGADAGLRIGAVGVRLPDVRRQQTAATERLDYTAPALAGIMAVRLFPGFSTGTLAGAGSISVIGSAAWLPFHMVNLDGLADDAAAFAWGAGTVIGLLSESGRVPAVNLSVMYRRLGRVDYGDVCPAGADADLIRGAGRGYDLAAGTCAVPADPGEFSFDLASWSSRAVVSKRLAGVGVAGGAGYDRYSSDVNFGLGANPTIPRLGTQPVYVRGSGLRLHQERWSGFANTSFGTRRVRVAAEAGWSRGGRALEEFDVAASAFDPARGAIFGSFGVRIGAP
jgi:hypothetical protein